VKSTTIIAVTFLAAAGACTIDRDPFEPTIDAAAGHDAAGPDALDAREGPPEILLFPANLGIAEGGSRALDVSLSGAPPVSPAALEILIDDENVATTPTSVITFTAADFAVPHTVEVFGVNDADALAATAILTVRGIGFLERTVPISVTDDDHVDIQAMPSSTINVSEGSTSTVQIYLAAQPAGPIMFTVTSNNTGKMTVSPPLLTFHAANWNTPQLVTLTGVEDADVVDETATLTVSTSASGIAPKTILVTVHDND
jgi:hypothetical protein